MFLPYIISGLILSIYLAHSDITQNKEPQDRIPLSPNMVINEQAFGNAAALVDEQHLNISSLPSSVWNPGWINFDYFPVSAVIDLGTEYNITHISWFDGKGHGSIHVQYGEPFKWEEGFYSRLKDLNSWTVQQLNKKTRYIRLQVNTRTFPHEIRLYGTPLDSSKINKTKKERTLPSSTMDKIIGVNAFIDDPIDKIKVGSFVREYHNWRWDASDIMYPHNVYAWNPSNAGNGWNFDQFYAKLSKEGIDVFPCLKGNADWIPGKMEDKPILFNRKSTDPSAYIAHADYLFQYVARYGSKSVEKEKLKLKENQKPESGMNLLRYIENWNEQNKTWEGVSGYFTPYEYAAMASADYDGHLGSIKGNISVKKADPDFKMVMGGLAGLDLDYIKSIKFWSDYHRSGSIPFDVINLHFYSRKEKGGETVGISPEEDSVRQKLEAIVSYRDKYMPDKQIWITEFGYDTHPQSPQRSPKIKDLSIEIVQAQWLVRAYLEIAAAGIDRAALYMLRDTNPSSATKYVTSGLTSDKKSGWKPKPSWYYIYTLKNVLKDMQFKENTYERGVNIYKFKHIKEKCIAYVVWSPTSEAKVIENFDLEITEKSGTNKITKILIQDGSIEGVRHDIELSGGSVKLDVSETPVFLLVHYE